MSRGPLPDSNALRRNKPTIPTTKLPAAGFAGEAPECAYQLREAGAQWWAWAWTLPQAAAWDDGSVFALSRRAQLEDDLALIDHPFEAKDLAELLGQEDNAVIRDLEFIVGRLAAMAGGRLSILKEMRELDRRFGLDAKALAELRWTIVEPDEEEEKAQDSGPATVRHLRAVDRSATG